MGDGKANDTGAIQAAMDPGAAADRGVVYLTPGRYLSGTVILKDNVSFHLEAAATLWAARISQIVLTSQVRPSAEHPTSAQYLLTHVPIRPW
jgi:polygalacturonase